MLSSDCHEKATPTPSVLLKDGVYRLRFNFARHHEALEVVLHGVSTLEEALQALRAFGAVWSTDAPFSAGPSADGSITSAATGPALPT